MGKNSFVHDDGEKERESIRCPPEDHWERTERDVSLIIFVSRQGDQIREMEEIF